MNAQTAPHKVFKQLLTQLTKTGEHFEVVDQKIDGRPYRVYKKAPATLKELMDSGRAHGDKTFLVYEGEQFSFEQFFAHSDAFARQMHKEWGIRAGDRVALAMRNYPEWMMAFTGIVQLGAVPVPINSWGSANEVRYVIKDSHARALITDQARYNYFAKDEQLPLPIVVARPDQDNRAPDWDTFIAQDKSEALPAYSRKPSDEALLMYTSGTTGQPKGVCTTHRQVCQAMFNFECVGMAMGMTSGDILAEVMKSGDNYAGLLTVPLFHVSGCYAVFLLNLRSGRRTVMMYKWDVAQAITLIEQERIGILSASPSMLMELYEAPEFARAKTDHLFAIGGGGSALPSELAGLIERKTANRLPGCGYGMTESNASATSMNGHLFRERPKAAGLCSPVMEVDIRDEQGASLPTGERGEIWLYGIAIASGYWQKPEATAQSFVDGWYRTGDIGYMDEAGYLSVVDRIKDVVIRGGENISSVEVEHAIDNHPAVLEVAVFGIPHRQLGEIPVAEVVVKVAHQTNEEEIKKHVSSQLAHFKVPEHVFLGTEPLPRNPIGKVLKKALRERRTQTG